MYEAVVVGIGAMGGGMARALLQSPVTNVVVGYDKSAEAVEKFFQESKKMSKPGKIPPSSLREAISDSTDFVVVSLVNESQCEQVCFGEGENLVNLMPKGSCVILTSTVTATWAVKANKTFTSSGIFYVDSPLSGGPARALEGDLTLMASGDGDSLEKAKVILDALAREVHVIEGGAGGGSTVKCVHQLLAGVHICAAAEAMAMGAKAGIDVDQLYRIVNGAAGASWMFTDRGKRMLSGGAEVNSALDIFVKDLDIVYAEAKKLKCPIPIASAALQQFISGQSLGLGRLDDSQVVKVYENITNVPVASKPGAPVGTAKQTDVAFSNHFLKVTRVKNRLTDIPECASESQCKLRLKLKTEVMDIELLKPTPVKQTLPLNPKYELLGSFEKFRVYKLSLHPNENVTATYPFFHLSATLTAGTIETVVVNDAAPIQWTQTFQAGELQWKEPSPSLKYTNAGDSVYQQYIVALI